MTEGIYLPSQHKSQKTLFYDKTYMRTKFLATKWMPIGDKDENFQQPWRRSLGQETGAQQDILNSTIGEVECLYPYRLSIRLYNNQGVLECDCPQKSSER